MIEKNKKLDYSEKDVAIVGIGFRLPGNCKRGSELWENLINGFDGIVGTSDRWSDTFKNMGIIHSKEAGLVELEEWESFDPIHFGINPAEAKQIDPQQKLLLKSTWEAFEDAGIDPLSLRGTTTSVFVGASASDFSSCNKENYEESNYNLFNSTTGGIANRISYCFDFRGPSLTVDTACSSSLNACLLGYKSIANNECDYSIVSGCNFILDPQISKAFTTINIIGKSGRCKTFDESADGFVRAEGVAVLILKKLSLAINDGDHIYSIIRGGNSNVDGTLNKGNFMKPSKSAQSNNIRKAFESTNGSLNYSDIDFFEVHGTGTPTGDPIEIEAVSDIFKSVKSKDNPLLVGSIKSNIGHLEPASGVASLMKICLMFKHRQFVKNIHFNKPNPLIKFDEWNIKVCTENIPFPSNKQVSIAINSFGITGSNVCMLLSEFQSNDDGHNNNTNNNNNENSSTSPIEGNSNYYLIPVSANSKKSLEEKKEELINNSSTLSENVSFKDFVYNQIYSKSTTLIQRSVIFSKDWNDLNLNTQIISTKSQMSGNIVKSIDNDECYNCNNCCNLVYIFCGQGPQWNKMGMELYNNEPNFKKSMDSIDSILEKHFKYSILSKLRSIKDDDKITINEPTIAQSSIFMIQVSLFQLYKQWGITPTIIVGHSFGEISAAYCSGMIDLETACEIIHKRSTLQHETIGMGKMLAIGLNEKQFNEQYSNRYPSIEICCYNSPSSIVIGGDELYLNEISKELKEKQIFSVLLGSPSPYHSSKQEIIKDKVLECTKHIKSIKPTIPIFSTVTGELFKNEDNQFNSHYIYDNIRNPVLFEKSIENILKYIESNEQGKNTQFLEISPHPTLLNYLKEMVNLNDSTFILPSLNKKNSDELNEINKTISQLYCNGYNVNFKYQLKPPTKNEIRQFKQSSYYLPLYKFDDAIYFTQSESVLNYKRNGISINQLGIKNELSPFISYTSYIDIAEEPFRFFKGHAAKGKTLFPGVGYIDNILKAFPNQDITIYNIEFKTPLTLTEGVKQCLTTNIYPSGKNEYRVVFNYKDNKTGKWILSAHGRFSTNKLNTPNKIDISKNIERKNSIKVSKKDIYESVKLKSKLNLTGPFQIIEESNIGNSGALYKINLKNPISSYDNQLFFNICILDACFHSLTVGKDTQNLTLFDRVINGQFYFENIPKSAMEREKYQFLYCYSEFIEKVGDLLYTKVVLMLPDGTVLFTTPYANYSEFNATNNNSYIEYPNNCLYSTEKQSIDSLLSSPFHFNLNDGNNIDRKSTISYLYSKINQKIPDITIETIIQNSIDSIILKYFNNDNNKKNLLDTVIQLLKNNVNLIELNPDMVENSIEIIDELIQYLFEASNDDLEIYKPELKQNDTILNIVSNAIKPILNEKIVFRILEIGCGIGILSENIIEQINQLLNDNPLSEISIEYTYSDKDSKLIQLIKDTIQQIISDTNSISFKTLFNSIDLQEDLLEQNFKPSYYDIIIINNVDGFKENDINSTINNINQLLYSNGYLIIMDTLYKSRVMDKQIELFEQWISFNLNNKSINKTTQQWKNILVDELFFKDFIITSNEPYLMIVQKPKIEEIVLSLPNSPSLLTMLSKYDQIIKYDTNLGHEDNIVSEIVNNGMFGVYKLTSFEEFQEHIKSNPLTDDSLLVFFSSVKDLNESNFMEITYDYIKINQHLLKTKCKCKHILISKNSQTSANDCSNYLGSSLIGAFRYFCDFVDLNIYSIDYGSDIYKKDLNDLKIYEELTNSNKHIQREFIIRNNKIYFEVIKQDRNIKQKYKSDSFIQENNQLISKIDTQTLDFKLVAKRDLEDYEVEVKVLASGINFKDNLIYRAIVPKESTNENGDSTDPQIGFECSGIITRIGNKVKRFKIGDSVLGTCFHSAASHVISNQDRFVFKPDCLSYVQAASIPLVYVTSYYSLLIQGGLNLTQNEIVLIHSGTGGIGLASIEILKAVGFNSLLFVTVGSEEKKQYLIEKYGTFITGIYSTRNTDYVKQIKKKINEVKNGEDRIMNQLGILTYGVDLILNTLSSEHMEANFNLLNQGGRIVDLSITHLSSTETTDYNKFKYFIGYSTVEIMSSGFSKVKDSLQTIVNMIQDEKLKPIPIIEYPVNEIKNAIEFIGERKHIGKIVVNFQTTKDLVQDTINKLNKQFDNNFIVQSPKYQLDNTKFGNTILITGQQGLSLAIIKWLLFYYPKNQQNNDDNDNKYIRDIIVLSKSSIYYELEIVIRRAQMNKLKTRIHFKQVDVSNKNQLYESIDETYKSNIEMGPIETIIHNAFTPVQSEPEDIDLQQLKDSHGAKTLGALNLYNYIKMKGWALKNCILTSSFTSIVGGVRQCGYVCANSVIDSFSKYLRENGVNCFSLNYSQIEQSGYVSRNESIEKLITSTGLNPISINTVLGSIDLAIQNQDQLNCKHISNFNFELLGKRTGHILYKFDFYFNQYQSNDNQLLDKNSEYSINDEIINKFSEILQIESSKINLDIKMVDYGLDSLSVVNLKTHLDQQYGFPTNLITISQLQKITINQLINIVKNELSKSNKSNYLKKKNQNQNNNNKQNKTNGNSNINWENETKLDSSIAPLTNDQLNNHNNDNAYNDNIVLLNEPTSFIGIYLLYDLIISDKYKFVYCLLDNNNNNNYNSNNNNRNEDGLKLIIQLLKHYQLYNKLTINNINKIQIVYGNYSKEQLGMSDEDYNNLSSQINILINCATDRNLIKKYEELNELLEGINQYVRFSIKNKIKKIIHLSAIGVYQNEPNVNDDYYLPSLESLDKIKSGYFQNRIVQEYLFRDAANKGIPSMIVRLPFLFSDETTGIGRDSDLVMLLLQSCYLMNTWPSELENQLLNLIPVTFASKSISSIITSSNIWNQYKSITPIKNLITFNLIANQISFGDIFNQLSLDLGWRKISLLQFIKKLGIYENEPCKALLSFISNQGLFNNLILDGKYKFNDIIKNYLIQNNQFNQYNVDKYSIIKYLSYTFKKKIL